jgi:uncharacterized membrane protein
MYSKAKISGHPIHPALIAFPVAFYVATAVVLITFAATHDAFWFHVSAYTSLAAVIMAAIAAVPGVIDLFSIPSGTRARQTAYTHALLNIVTLLLFVIVTMLVWRQWRAWPTTGLDARVPIVLSVIGVASLVGAGAFGWRLVQTHHVGVIDPLPAEELGSVKTTLPGTGPMREPHPRAR